VKKETGRGGERVGSSATSVEGRASRLFAPLGHRPSGFFFTTNERRRADCPKFTME